MADWVHCNSCYIRPGGGKLFSLTNCGHIYCADCLKANPDQCTICKRACNSIALSSQMKPEVEMYFTNPIDLSKKYYTQLSQVLEFQKSHRQRLAANIEKKVLAAERLQKHMTRLQELEREVAVLQEENNHLKSLLASSSSRPGAPHNFRNSPGTIPGKRGHTPSPTCSQYSSSPYGKTTPNSSQKENKGSHHWQNQLSRPVSGPTRLSVRTPPCNGFMGTVRGTPSPNKQDLSRPGSAGGTSGTVLRNHLQGIHLARTANTPGSYEAVTPSGLGATGVTCSPMAMSSPVLTIRSTTLSSNRFSNRSQYTTPSSSQASSQSNLSTQQSERCSPEIPAKISDSKQTTLLVSFKP
ncbi:RING finger protein C14orf164 [Stylophora pistillata]|uniref:RING finger protein C14orf164 n=1 Tax=Stylophora pistillata TaxID=50429 RepID=A0A2B4SQW2_STYPI|nr:RING finger protein C14orf164 [Stylophora pistillata]